MALGGILVKLGGPLKGPIARALYSEAMQHPAAKKFQRWAPLAGTTAYVAVIALKIVGIAGAEDALEFLHMLGIKPEVSEIEISAAVGGAVGLAGKLVSLAHKAQTAGEVIPPTSKPILQTEAQQDEFILVYNELKKSGVQWDDARKQALALVISKHTTVPIPKSVIAQAEAAAKLQS